MMTYDRSPSPRRRQNCDEEPPSAERRINPPDIAHKVRLRQQKELVAGYEGLLHCASPKANPSEGTNMAQANTGSDNNAAEKGRSSPRISISRRLSLPISTILFGDNFAPAPRKKYEAGPKA